MIRCIGVILAGGKSSRMGEDKAMVVVNKRTMLDQIKDTLLQTSLSEVVVNKNVELRPSSTGNQFSVNEDTEYIKDLIPDKGPLSGIHSALCHYPDADILVVPVDIPLITSASLDRLIETAREHGTNARFLSGRKNTKSGAIKINTTSKHHAKSSALPLYIHNNRNTRDKIEYILKNLSNYSVFDFCSHFPIQDIELLDENELMNVNYPEQVQTLNQC
jgi:molybdopterin-guanine dinucleotide biosynthesis protein A